MDKRDGRVEGGRVKHCLARDGQMYECMRQKGHDGDHEAWGINLISKWPNLLVAGGRVACPRCGSSKKSEFSYNFSRHHGCTPEAYHEFHNGWEDEGEEIAVAAPVPAGEREPADDDLCTNCGQKYSDHAAHGDWCVSSEESGPIWSTTKKFVKAAPPLAESQGSETAKDVRQFCNELRDYNFEPSLDIDKDQQKRAARVSEGSGEPQKLPGDWLLEHPDYEKWERSSKSLISGLDDIVFRWRDVVHFMHDWAEYCRADSSSPAGGRDDERQLQISWAASPEMRDLVKEIVAVGKPYLADCDEIGMKDGGWKAKMPKLAQWLSICAKAQRMADKIKAAASSPRAEGGEKK